MSDEYTSSGSGFQGSLVNPSLDPKDAQPLNNPPQDNDTTSEGGYGGDAFSEQAQIGSDRSSRGTLGQGEYGKEQAKSGAPKTAAGYNEQGENAGLSDALNPYGDSSQDLDGVSGSGEADRRGQVFESGPGVQAEQDDGAQGQV